MDWGWDEVEFRVRILLLPLFPMSTQVTQADERQAWRVPKRCHFQETFSAGPVVSCTEGNFSPGKVLCVPPEDTAFLLLQSPMLRKK